MDSSSRSAWGDLAPHLAPLLGDEDDPMLWAAVVNDVYADAEYLFQYNPKERWIDTVIGRCSHWLRPHQTRWTADGGFAWPSGYGGRGFSRQGDPEHDWEVNLFWDFERSRWTLDDPRKRFDPRSLVTFRVSVPARTTRHAQAAIRTTWIPGSPPSPKDGMGQFYGYRKGQSEWALRAVSGRPAAYSKVAEVLNPSYAEPDNP